MHDAPPKTHCPPLTGIWFLYSYRINTKNQGKITIFLKFVYNILIFFYFFKLTKKNKTAFVSQKPFKSIGYYNPAFRLATINLSKSPFNTACVFEVSTPVRKSLMRESSNT